MGGGRSSTGDEGHESEEGGCSGTGDEGHEGKAGGRASNEGHDGKAGGRTSNEGHEGEEGGRSTSHEGYEGVSRRRVCQWRLRCTCLPIHFAFGHRPTVLTGSRGARPPTFEK